MPTRREFLTTTSLAGAAALLPAAPFSLLPAAAQPSALNSRWPPLAQRKFVSPAVEQTIAVVADAEPAGMFENCLPNTLDTMVAFRRQNGQPDTFVLTGDIPAMWLRDSSAQVWPSLPLAARDDALRALLAGVIHRQSQCLLIDPCAHAFNDGPAASPWQNDLTDMKPALHEHKWEIDSLCHPLRRAHGFWKATGETAPFDEAWRRAMALVVRTFKEQQRWHGPSKFQRRTPVASDTVPLGGYGNPTRPNGMIHSMFRPSDDACLYPLFVPGNLFAVTALRQLPELVEAVCHDAALAGEWRAPAAQVQQAVEREAVVAHPKFGRIFAYEIDGFGNYVCRDDASLPSLLALPYLGCCALTDAVYQNTRRFMLSEDNPYFHRGAAAEGIGSPHVGWGMIWHLSVIVRVLTSTSDAEIRLCLRMLKATHAGTGFLHESFQRDDPAPFTRPWFEWANTLFDELILKLHAERPQLLHARL